MKLSFKLFVLVCLAAQFAFAQGTITTIAGKPFVFPSGDVPALQAPLGQITGVAVDSAGNLLATDRDNDFVVRITPAGILSVVSLVAQPRFLAVDPNGTIWVRSVGGIRRVRADGGTDEIFLSRVVSPQDSFAVGPQNDFYISDAGTAQVVKFTATAVGQWTGQILAGDGQCRYAGDSGPALSASLCEPRAVALDAAGNVYVADFGNSRIRRIGPDGIITTIAGNGQRGIAGDGGPALQASVGLIPAMTVDASGNLFFVDCGAGACTRVRRIDSRGVVTTVAGGSEQGFSGDGGPAISARLNGARALAVDASGNLLIADASNRRVRRVSNGVIQTIAGNALYKSVGDGGPAIQASLNTPGGLVLDTAGQIYVSETGSHRVRKIDGAGVITNFAGSSVPAYGGDGGPASAAFLNEPGRIAFDPGGNLYIVERGNNVLRRVRRDGIIETVVPSLRYTADIAIDAAGTIYLAQNQGVLIADPITGATTPFLPGSGVAEDFTAVASDQAGNLSIGTATAARGCPGRVLRINRSGTRSQIYSGNCVYGLATDREGNVFVAESAAVIRVYPDGTAARVAGRGPECSADIPAEGVEGGPAACEHVTPGAVATDAAGNLLIADSARGLIRLVTPCRFSLPQTTLGISAIGGSSAAAVNTAPGCAWQGRSNVSWLAVTSPPGFGAGNLYLSFGTNPSPSPRTGTISIAGLTLTVTQAGAVGESTPPAERSLTRRLSPGFYIAEALLQDGANGGFWGMEIIASRGQTAGGLNFGGGMGADGHRLGFGAFLLATDQTITASLNAFAPAGTQLTMRLLDAQRQEIARSLSPVSRLQRSLPAGFYIIEVSHTADVPVNYLLGVEAPGFAGGMDVGGYIGPGITGFGAFYVPEEQEVTIRLLGRNSYGAAGAGAMTLALRDAARNVLDGVPAP